MRILFLTTLSVTFEREHFFTRNVIEALVNAYADKDEIVIGTVNLTRDNDHSFSIEKGELMGVPYWQCHIRSNDDQEIISDFCRFYKEINPDIIHSNQIEGYDVKAARECSIPIVLTMHIGGLICPRGGGKGLLRWDDTICDGVVGDHCAKCMIQDLPFPKVGGVMYKILKGTPLETYFANKFPPVFYMTPLMSAKKNIRAREEEIGLFQYAHVIAANESLYKMLGNQSNPDHIHLIPHGVKPRKRLPLPELKYPIKFYLLSRFDYSKGIYETIRAFENIPGEKYELHIIGDSGKSRADQNYYHKCLRIAENNKSIRIHGRIPNTEIESVIKDCHVMIHSSFFHEIYGIAIAESLAMGRPVLATRCGGAEMQIKDNVNGWLIPPHDIHALHNKIVEILDDPQKIKIMSDHTELPMPIDKYIRKVRELYDEITNM